MSRNGSATNWHKRVAPYLQQGYVNATHHPTLPLTIYNYSRKAMFDRVWDAVTTRTRGLVVDRDGRAVNAPFRKFFNAEEPEGQEIVARNADNECALVEKMDGSVVYVTKWAERLHWHERLRGRTPRSQVLVHSRGSFTSRQALDARDWLVTYHPDGLGWVEDGYTYAFEWISPDNRIVVDYGERRELVLIGRTHIETGDFRLLAKEWTGATPAFRFHQPPFDPAVYKDAVPENREGYVVTWFNGDRVKIKGEDYLRKHRMISGLTTYAVWEAARDDRWFEFNEPLDEEMRMWATNVLEELHKDGGRIAASLLTWVDENHNESVSGAEFGKKVQAEFADRRVQAAVFAYARKDGDAAWRIIWKMLRPLDKTEMFGGGLSS